VRARSPKDDRSGPSPFEALRSRERSAPQGDGEQIQLVVTTSRFHLKSYTLATMARRYSSIGLFGIFGRSGDLRQVDSALRAIDVHPRLVPEAVKLTIAALLKERAEGGEPLPPAYRAAAEIVGYCMIGAEAFAGANGEPLALEIERRIELAVISGTNLDAQLVLLTLHAGVCQPSVIDRFQLESAAG
jgi:hypothetical protein